MRGRTILILLGVLVVLVAVATLFETNRRKATRGGGKPFFKGLKTEQVDGIRFITEGEETILEKKDGVWLVASEGNYRAEQKLVQDIVDKLPRFMADEIVSTNPANQSLFRVDSTGIEVWVDQSGKEIGHFFIGKPGSDFLSTYVRSAASNDVIVVPEYLPSLFQRGETWRERTLNAFAQEDINRYEYASPTRGRVVVVKQDDGQWRMEEPDTGRVEPSRLSVALRTFASLKADGFADTLSAVAAGLEPDTAHVKAVTSDGQEHAIHIGATAPGLRFYIRKPGGSQIYTLAKGRLNSLMVRKEALLGGSTPPGM